MITRTCRVSGKKFTITESDLEFYAKMGIISQEDLVKLKSREISDCVGLPTLCPEERQKKRIAHRNFTKLYSRKCDATGKAIISLYHKDAKFPVYENKYWWGDEWNPLDYGRDFDFSRDFFSQFLELKNEVPHFSTYNTKSENCDYSTAFASKNCYLIGGCVRNEDCAYGHIVWDSQDCFDNLYLNNSQWCSNLIDCINCYELHFSEECAHCSDSYFLYDCRNCKNCFACTNLRGKQYCFMNKQLTKEEYEKKIREILPLTTKVIADGQKWLQKIKLKDTVFPEMFGLKNENVSGNHIYESRNCHITFDAKKSEDSKFLYTSYNQENSYDISFTGEPSRFTLEGLSVHGSENSSFCFDVHSSVNMLYSGLCFNCKDCFGCIGLKHAQYCILNKQYTKEEYEKIRGKIIEHMKNSPLVPLNEGEGAQSASGGVEWGQFFPMELSPFAYNESVANEYFPLSKEEIEKRGLKYRAEKQSFKYDGPKYEIPAKISDVPDDICDKILTCEATGKYYKIQKAELKFYRKMNLPVPRLCPDERHKRRMALRNPRTLFERSCNDCGKDIQTTFAPDRPEKVLCEECYLKTI